MSSNTKNGPTHGTTSKPANKIKDTSTVTPPPKPDSDETGPSVNKVEDIILNLKIIGAIHKKDRLSRNDDDIFEIESNDFLQGVRRWYTGQNRHDTIKGIRKIIQAAFTVTDQTLADEHTDTSVKRNISQTKSASYFTQENSSLLQKFTIEMERACGGLENLKSTYSDDVRINSEIDIMIEQLRLRIEKINKILKIDLGKV
jgi:hypothetical protein